jgi:hypothetical protein
MIVEFGRVRPGEVEVSMTTRMCAGLALAAVLLPGYSGQRAQPVALPLCRHDNGQEADRTRREQAVALAKAINHAEGTVAERIRVYRPLSQLAGLPPVPNGFEVRLYTDGGGYVFSIKDTLDPCRYGIFSDEAGVLYEKTPQPAPLVARPE